MTTTFAIGESDFLRDGAPHRILAGALHYFRVHPDQWADRIHKARLMGLNTIETYVAWNAHEPRRGEWDATGANDLGRFLDLIAAEGMDAIVRPGPYICAEWHNGGLPVWLTGMGLPLRSSDATYLTEVTAYLERVYEIVAPRQIDRGGPVVLVQIENEYGAYGADEQYLRELVRLTRVAGITVPLTTVDQPVDRMLADGSLDELHRTGSFGSRVPERLATLRRHQKTGPLMCSEFWDGWFDWWGGVHHTTDAGVAASDLDDLLSAGASVNFYMFHGGTNFGTTNGANHKGRYLPLTTSYDYDAPLDEAGNPTAKFHAFREVIAKYAPVPPLESLEAQVPPVLEVPVSATGGWADVDGDSRSHPAPPTFDALGTLSPLVRYETDLAGRGGLLVFGEVRDLAWVQVDGVSVGRLARTFGERSLVIPAGKRLTVLVEDQGRVNYGHLLGEEKGLIGAATLDGAELIGWFATAIPVEADAAVTPVRPAAPTAFRGEFHLDAASDLVLDTSSWGKGFAFVNGFALGRYWRNGPTSTMYVPGPVTRAGANTVTMLEIEHPIEPVVTFVASAELGFVEE
ncbi:beta-galactosidase family protein [Microbacterium sp. H1-D42]|uniref:glycoside hydrolase family 35 protein n=1 Tax=Microbacterium sp. H1-D42 TaxID=2925844 RepID=UPI001F52B858|nr:beta-galactosidase family protein [Microbacterium sp. H1-D42]UNK70326.1 beta-galactosidase [Microbacterium sp. H1-D42]